MATKERKKLTDPSNNRRKVIMYGCPQINPDGTVTVGELWKTRTEAVSKSSDTCGICKVEMLVPSEKNQWTITVREHAKDRKTLKLVRTRKFTLETVNRPLVWGTNKLTNEAVQAYIDAYIGDDPKEIENFKECNGTLNLYSDPRSQQIN